MKTFSFSRSRRGFFGFLFLVLAVWAAGCGVSTSQLEVTSGPISTFRPVVSSNTLSILNKSQLELYWTFVRRTEAGFWFGSGRPAYRLLPQQQHQVQNLGSGIHYIAVSIPAETSSSGGFEYLYTLELLVSPRTEPVVFENVTYPNVAVVDFIPREVEVDGVRVQRIVEWGEYLVRRGLNRPLDVLLINTIGRGAK